MAFNNSTNGGRQRPSNKFVPEGGGGWSRQQQSESSKYYANLNGQQKQILAQLSEMFGQSLDREIIFTLAASCDWDVNVAIESLIEISQDNGYSAPPPDHRRSYEQRPPNQQRPSARASPQHSASKVAYQGYDNTDDADIIVEEEEEFEIVTQVPVQVSRLHATRDADAKSGQQKKIPMKSQSPTTYGSIQASINSGERLLVLMRGMPGSGKSFAARKVLVDSGTNRFDLLFSTDDFFSQGGRFRFTPENLSDAHDWNRARVALVMKQGLSPVIVDNTNSQAWEMKPYLHLAVQFGYRIELLEPSTPWCWREAELAQRNVHGVPRHTIRKMIDRYEKWMIGPLLAAFNLRYSPHCIPPQRCSNPPVGSYNRPTNSPTKSVHMPVKSSNSPARSVNMPVMDINSSTRSTNPHTRTPNGNSNSPIRKAYTPLLTVNHEADRLDLASNVVPLPQRVKNSDNVNVPTLTDKVDKVLLGDMQPLSLHTLATATVNKGKTDANQLDAKEDPFDLPPTPPEWIPLTWESIPGLQLLPDTSVVLSQSVQVSTEVFPLEASSSEVSPDVIVEQLISIENSPPKATACGNEELALPQEPNNLEAKEDEVEKEEVVELKTVVFLLDENKLGDLEKEVEEKLSLLDSYDIMDSVVSPVGQEMELVDGDVNGNEEKPVDIAQAQELLPSVEDARPTDIIDELELKGDSHVAKKDAISDEIEIKSDSYEFSLVDIVPDSIKTEELIPATDQVPTTLSCDVSSPINIAQASQSISMQVSNVPQAEVDSEEKRSPKLNLFSWLFPKKSKPVSSTKTESSPPESTPWQPYEPTDNSASFTNSVESSGKIEEETAMTNSNAKEAVHDESRELASMEPMSLLLDAAELEVVPDLKAQDDETSSDLQETKTEACEADKTSSDLQETKAETCEADKTSNEDHVQDLDLPVTDASHSDTLDSVYQDTKDHDSTLDTKDLDSTPDIFLDASDVSSPLHIDKPESFQTDPLNLREGIVVEGVSIDDDIPELSVGNLDSWAKLSPTYVLEDEISNIAAVSSIKKAQDDAPVMSDAETITSHVDFSLLDQELQNELPVISGSSRSINVTSSALPPRPHSNTYTLDRGTMTSPMEGEPCDEDFELLVKMFPKIPCEDLTEVFERCEKEINWTVELLLESGYAFEPSPDLEVRFEDSARLLETQELLEELNIRDSSFIQPRTPGDSFHSATNPLTASDTKSRHFGLFGSDESLDEAKSLDAAKLTEAKVPENRSTEVKTSPTKKAPKKQSQLTMQLKKQMEETFVLNPDCYSEETLRIKRIRHGEGSVLKTSGVETAESSRARPSHLTLPSTSGLSPKLDDSSDMEEDDDQNTVPMTVHTDFMRQLEEMFGELLLPCADEKVVVDLPVSLVRQIHGYIAESKFKQLEMQEQYFNNMIKDEEFARRLQAEEELPPPDLQQIMDMELALELYRTESAPCQTAEDLATRLSKQKLAELFPGVDRAMLFDVFEAHGRSFADTLAVLEASTGEVEEAARTVMSPQAMAAYEKQLIEKAREESTKQSASKEEETVMDTASVATPKEQAMNDAQSYRDEANRLYKLRNQCYQKASDAQRSGMQSVASYYAQVGHLYKQRIELANSQAASALLSAHSVDNRCTTLDLHFLYVVEALEALDIFLDHHIAGLADRGQPSEAIFIITGSGVHSIGGKPRIKPAVQKRLTQRKMKYQEVNSGLLKVMINKHAQLTINTK